MKSGEPKKDKAIGIRLPLETYEAIKARADAERRSLSNYLLLLIERDLHQSDPARHPDPRHQALRQIEAPPPPISSTGTVILPPGVEIIKPDPSKPTGVTRTDIEHLQRETQRIKHTRLYHPAPLGQPPQSSILNEPPNHTSDLKPR